jgi:putative acetyltransferase
VTADLRIAEDDLNGPEIAALLRFHIDEMFRMFPPASVHSLPLERLREPDVTFYSAWHGRTLAGCGALKQLDPEHGEIKSMRTAPEWLGRGVGKAVLRHLLAEARARGYARVSLETGTNAELLPARRLYAAHGFVPCPAFAGYSDEDPLSLCMTLALTAP